MLSGLAFPVPAFPWLGRAWLGFGASLPPQLALDNQAQVFGVVGDQPCLGQLLNHFLVGQGFLDKMLFPEGCTVVRPYSSLKRKGRCAPGCISKRLHIASHRAFCKG